MMNCFPNKTGFTIIVLNCVNFVSKGACYGNIIVNSLNFLVIEKQELT